VPFLSPHQWVGNSRVLLIKLVSFRGSRPGRDPVEQPQNNPGFDIVSAVADGTPRRLIEVKGLEGEWTERGVKLSHVQFATAQTYPGEYWLYVVEQVERDRFLSMDELAMV
jgi:hypothetical protein